MHFALPPRKSSSPPPYTRASARSVASQRRQQIQYLSYFVLFILTIYLVYRWTFSRPTVRDNGIVPKDSSILIVTVLDKATMSDDYITMIKANREDYATRHGYKTFYTNTSSYQPLLESSPLSWALIPALRNALTLHPQTDYIWSLSPHALITNVTLDLHTHIFSALPALMRKDIPVVPPDSVIHTFSHLTPSTANLVITQDFDNLAHTSFLLRNTLAIPQPPNKPKDTWTYFFLDAWFDPLYRTYAFQKAENHALEHIVQWHPTILAKLVVIDQRRLNSYNFQYPSGQVDPDTGVERQPTDSMWREGDFIVNFKGCTETEQRDCEKEMRTYFERWKVEVERLDGRPKVVPLKVDTQKYVPKNLKDEDALKEYELKRTHI